MDFIAKDQYGIHDLLEIMKLLRSPDGCPWDRVQTHQSIRKNFLEETCEVLEAIDLENAELLKEELGDVLLQVVFHAQMEQEAGRFTFDEVCDGICKKLIHRHPHIFSDEKADTPEQVLRNWEEIKKQEKRQTTQAQALNSVPKTLPALMRGEKVQARAAKVGFDYEDAAGAMKDLRSEVDELSEAIASGRREEIWEELGDLLFSVANVARFVKVDSEQALGNATDKFIRRFTQVERLADARGIDMKESGMDVLDNLWQEAKIKDQ